MIILFICLFLVIYFDARLLKRKFPERYRVVMQFPPVRWAIYATLFVLAMLPIYLLRRRRFFEQEVTLEPKDMTLADGFELFLKWFCGVMLCVIAIKSIGWVVHGFRGS